MSRWFRIYDDVLDDPKVQRLPAELFKAWINVLCLASKNGGVLPAAEDCAFGLRTSVGQATEAISGLVRAGLVDANEDGTLAPHNWNGRQFGSDSSTPRVRRFRNGGRNVSSTVSGNVSSTVSSTVSGNVSSTVSRNVSETPAETPAETDTDTDISEANASLVDEGVDASPSRLEKPGKKKNLEELRVFGESWNQLAGACNLPLIDEIKPRSMRERHALARLREMPADGIERLMARIRGSPWLRGELNEFRASFDWIIKAANYQKIMEGNYEDRKITPFRRS